MKLCRFNHNRLGLVDGATVHDVSAALDILPKPAWPIPWGDLLIAHLEEVRSKIATLLADAPSLPLTEILLESPIANPSKIIGAPVNYREHCDEIDETLRHGHTIRPIAEWGLFLKANSALCGPSMGISRRFPNERTDHEVELAVIIGRGGHEINRSNAMQHVAGYSIGLDITLRGPQFQSFRKSIDTYSMLGPWLVTADEIPDPSNLDIGIRVNGAQRQRSNTSLLIYDVPRLIEYASSFYTLFPGDVIMTGTPAGVGPIQPGDVLEAEISNIGTMTTVVHDA